LAAQKAAQAMVKQQLAQAKKEAARAAREITADCPHCGSTLRIPRRLAGREVTCPVCQTSFNVPESALIEVVSLPPAPAPPLPVGATTRPSLLGPDFGAVLIVTNQSSSETLTNLTVVAKKSATDRSASYVIKELKPGARAEVGWRQWTWKLAPDDTVTVSGTDYLPIVFSAEQLGIKAGGPRPPILFNCPACSTPVRFTADLEGKPVRCPRCSKRWK
jgi:hypothetical protein